METARPKSENLTWRQKINRFLDMYGLDYVGISVPQKISRTDQEALIEDGRELRSDWEVVGKMDLQPAIDKERSNQKGDQ